MPKSWFFFEETIVEIVWKIWRMERAAKGFPKVILKKKQKNKKNLKKIGGVVN